MVAPLILVWDNNGDLHDQEGHLRNASDQRINAQGDAIPEPDATATGITLPVDEAAQPKTLADYDCPDRYYTNRSAILPPTIEVDFELKAQYYTLVGQLPYHGLSHLHPMDHLDRFEDLIYAIRVEGVSKDYLLCKLFRYSLKQLQPRSLKS